jgi:hypothetical protein
MAIYDLPGIINISLHLAATPANIKAVFKVAVIYPYNRNVFPEEEFLPSYVTDRLYPEALEHRMAREYRLMRQHNTRKHFLQPPGGLRVKDFSASLMHSEARSWHAHTGSPPVLIAEA